MSRGRPLAAYAALLTVLNAWHTIGADDHFTHIAVGRLILSEGRIPDRDPFSFSMPGAPWTNWEWLYGVLIAAAYDGAGWWGLLALRLLVVGGTLAIVTAVGLRRGASTPAIVLALSLVSAFVMFRAADRPHVFVWPFTAITMLVAGGPHPLRLVPLFVLWGNLHPSWPLGVFTAVLAAFDAGRARGRTAVHALGAAALLGAGLSAAALVSPFGLHVAEPARTVATRSVAPEWDPLYDFGWWWVAAYVSAGGALWALQLRTMPRAWGAIAWLATGLVQGVRHVRLAADFAPGAALLWLRAPAAADGGAPMRVAAAVSAAFAVFAVVHERTTGHLRWGTGTDLRLTPVGAFDVLDAHNVDGNIFNDVNAVGGYTVFRRPKSRTFIDGRVPNVFPTALLDEWRQAASPEARVAYIRRAGADLYVQYRAGCLPAATALADALVADGAYRWYDDGNFTLWSWVRPDVPAMPLFDACAPEEALARAQAADVDAVLNELELRIRRAPHSAFALRLAAALFAARPDALTPARRARIERWGDPAARTP